MGLLQKGFSAAKQGMESYKAATKAKKAAKTAKSAKKAAEKAGGQALVEEAKQAKLARKGQKKIDRKKYGGGKKGKANKAADIARKAAASKMEEVGMGDSTDDTSMDGASMANPMRKKPRKKKRVAKKVVKGLEKEIKRAKNGVRKTKNITPPSSNSNSKQDFEKIFDDARKNKAMKKMGASRPDLSKTKKIKDNKTKMGASMMEKKGASMSGENYDAKQAYNKNLSASARLHYLENNRADKKAKGGSHRSPIMKHMKNI